MQNHTVNSSERLESAKERLKESLVRLERLIQKQNEKLSNGKKIRGEVMKDLDSYIQDIELLLKGQN
jgi:hypothetical protein